MHKIDRMEGEPIIFALATVPNDDRGADPIFIAGVVWYVCATCGFTELVDANPAETIGMMKAPNE